MQLNEYQKIVFRRASFNKKVLLQVLACFFHVSQIHHDELSKTYIIDCNSFANFGDNKLDLFIRLVQRFSHYNEVHNDKLVIRYAW